MNDLLVGLGVALVFEGLLWALVPDAARRMAADLAAIPNNRLTPVAWGIVAAGCLLVWMVRG